MRLFDTELLEAEEALAEADGGRDLIVTVLHPVVPEILHPVVPEILHPGDPVEPVDELHEDEVELEVVGRG